MIYEKETIKKSVNISNMMNKRTMVMLLFVGIFLISFSSAYLGTFEQNDCISIVAPLNATSVNITNINYPNGTIILSNELMDKNGNLFNYTFCNTSALGTYTYGFCDNLGNCYSNSLDVTKSGEVNGSSGIIIFIFILFIIATIGLFITFFLTLIKLVTAEETIFGVLTTWAFFILMIIVNFMAKTYMNSLFVDDLSSTFITITTWSNGVLPMISLFISIFIRSTKKKKLLTPQEMTGRFTFDGGGK